MRGTPTKLLIGQQQSVTLGSKATPDRNSARKLGAFLDEGPADRADMSSPYQKAKVRDFASKLSQQDAHHAEAGGDRYPRAPTFLHTNGAFGPLPYAMPPSMYQHPSQMGYMPPGHYVGHPLQNAYYMDMNSHYMTNCKWRVGPCSPLPCCRQRDDQSQESESRVGLLGPHRLLRQRAAQQARPPRHA